MSSFVERVKPLVSWQADQMVRAKTLASSMPLSELLAYHEWLKAKIKENSLKHRKELMVAAKAIVLKTQGFSSEAVEVKTSGWKS